MPVPNLPKNDNAACLCFRCMDFRLDSRKTHGDVSYVVANAGASTPISPDDEGMPLSFQVASFFLLYQQAKADKRLVITASSGHFDCLAVKKIWEAGIEGKPITERFEKTLYPPYFPLAQLVKDEGLNRTDSLRLLAAAKTLEDINHCYGYPEVRKAVAAGTLKIVVYYEDPTFDPHRLFTFDFAKNQFTEPRPTHFSFLKMRYTMPGPQMVELKNDARLLYQYEVPRAVDVKAFVRDEAQRLREGSSILLPQNHAVSRATRFVASLTKENARYAIKYVVRGAQRIARNIPARHI